MTDLQKILCALLDDLSAICASIDAEFCLADRLAWDALKYGGFHDNTIDAFVNLPAAAVQPLLAEVERAYPQRVVERYQVDGNEFLRLVAADTTLLDMNGQRYFEHPGIAVTIRVLPEPDEQGEVGYRLDEHDYSLPLAAIFPPATGNFEGRELPLPADVGQYFSILVDPDWKRCKYTGSITREAFSVLVDCRRGYQAMMQLPQVRELLNPEHLPARHAFVELLEQGKAVTRRAEQLSYYPAMSYDRFLLWEKYYPQREQIAASLAAGDLEHLTQTLQPCIDKVEHYLAQGLGLYFDAVIHAALVELLLQQKGQKFIDAWQELIPEQHQSGVASLLQLQGVAHPLLEASGSNE
ncbi:MAG: hypothetical protein LBR39_05065 [Coriobacteriales bacterium]|jgi:hypothetical protein|nr:hypothetical protein [Coriobacteriales bacterium]